MAASKAPASQTQIVVRKLAWDKADFEIKMRLFTCLTLIAILTACSDRRVISVDITVDKLSIDNIVVNKTDFEGRLKATVDSLVNSGFEKATIDVQVTADRQISGYEMSEIEKAIRRQGVTRDYFWRDK
ncbi:MAG: hypothetical protein EBR30_21180 [Cytophagia bacterium]|nr:hypothetical protein [Cytophagia bacterium]NBW37481.1 hypothetical protein [Cytophagia bacterium]